MKETGIIMSGNHPKLIIDGVKTQTRRVIKPTKETEWLLCSGWDDSYIKDPGNELISHCPYGQVGDRLWVKETFVPTFRGLDCLYKADEYGKEPNLFPVSGWKPSIFMPRWASSITLEITEIRVERVQEITEEDAEAEGVLPCFERHLHYDNKSYRCNFQFLWDSLNAKRGYSWSNNPWVWVISFRRLNEQNKNRMG
jgi:hypothetical protein